MRIGSVLDLEVGGDGTYGRVGRSIFGLLTQGP